MLVNSYTFIAGAEPEIQLEPADQKQIQQKNRDYFMSVRVCGW